MRTGRLFRGWVAAAAVGATPAVAQPPAARLVPIDPNRLPAVPVARSAYPDIPDSDVQPVPAQGYAGQPRPPERSRTWVGGAWTGMKELVVGKPTAAEVPNPVPPARPPAPKPQTAPTATPVPQPATPQPAVYAGPPAYRWYGYGSTTPGANQYAPHGLYPKGSANWYLHTGATPGAFPVPIQYPPGTPGVEPPVYAGNPNGYDAAYRVPPTRPEPEPAFDPWRAPRAASAPPAVEPPPGLPAAPSVPSGPPVALPAVGVTTDLRQTDLNWQTVAPGTALPTSFPTPPRPAATSPLPSAEPQWVPATGTTHPGTIVPAALSVTPLARGQQADPPDVTALVRSACFSRVNQVRVAEAEKGKLTVTFLTTSEQLAREAADLVSKLPELRAYEVRFEVQLTK